VQSTWFPLIHRNPQRFVRSIYEATAKDFTKATQRVYCSPSLPSHIVLPIVSCFVTVYSQLRATRLAAGACGNNDTARRA